MATITNQATLTYNGVVTSSNIAVGELLEVLTVSKTAVRESYAPGEDVAYVITLVNSGPAPLTDLTVTDDLGGYAFGGGTVYPLTYAAGSIRYYVNGALQAAPAVTAGPPLQITGITVPAGGNVALVYEAEVTGYAPLGAERTIVNTAAVSGAGITAAQAEETIGTRTGPVLSILKSLSPNPVTENGRLTYTFVMENSGSLDAAAADSVVLTDTFDPRLSNLTVTLNGTALTAPTQYTYDAATGLFSTVAGVVTVPAATVTQDTATGAYSIVPGTATITVTGTV